MVNGHVSIPIIIVINGTCILRWSIIKIESSITAANNVFRVAIIIIMFMLMVRFIIRNK